MKNMYVLERLDSPMGKSYLKCIIGHSMQFTRNPDEAALFCEDAAMQMAMAACRWRAGLMALAVALPVAGEVCRERKGGSMTTKEVTVTKYIACDDQEFITRAECEAHEREVRNLLEHEVYELRGEKRQLLFAINEARIKARIAWIDAEKWKQVVTSAMSKSKYHLLMADYWNRTSVYNTKRRELREVRRRISVSTDRLYMWFGLHKKSWVAKLERKRRSEEWRKANTPDKWRTPNKIRVSKPPKEEQ